MGRPATLIFVSLLLLVFGNACGDDAQLIVVIDTDLVTPAQMKDEPTAFVPAATFDRLRVEMIFEGQPIRFAFSSGTGAWFQDFAIGPNSPWPVTFGIRDNDLGPKARMLITLYRSDNVLREFSTFYNADPSLRLAVDRLAVVEVPASGKQTVRIVLHGACLGRPADLDAATTCIDDPAVARNPDEGIEHPAGVPPTVAGTFPAARSEPCTLPSPSPDAVCVPGAIASRGDDDFGRLLSLEGFLASSPRHLVQVHAFYMDRTEVTVGRFRELAATLGGEEMPLETSAEKPGCTWTPSPAENEDRPVNCIQTKTAEAYCRARGGELPTDAQWELAARGRGARTPYVWGSADPACCAARLAEQLGCPVRVGPSPVGSFTDAAKCEGRADVTVDGVFDLAGNVREIVRDGSHNFSDEECEIEEASGLLVDPVCDARALSKAARGGSFLSSFDGAKAAIRSRARVADDVGFRCVYRGLP